MKILVTGGAGFIGSHTCVELLNRDYQLIVVDNLSNSKFEAIRRVEKITDKKITFYNVDLLDNYSLENIFRNEAFQAVIHFAGFKAVNESVSEPLKYYNNNITGTLNLLALMKKFYVKNLVFSSSATVYGTPETLPLTENCRTSTTNPYGTSKLFIEQILKDLHHADKSFNIMVLRYFNPIGAHFSGLIGEDPKGIPNNLLPYISQVAIGKLPSLSVYGDDYDTVDGTGVRDYIHVVDLAIGHIKALENINKCGYRVYNLCTGFGVSVLQIIKTFERVSSKKIPYKIVGRREGDVAAVFSSPEKAYHELGFRAVKSLENMCEDSWRWQTLNAKGYGD